MNNWAPLTGLLVTVLLAAATCIVILALTDNL